MTLESVFSGPTDAMAGAPAVALAAAFAWGVFSIVLSPCHLASIPLIVGYLQGGGAVRPRRAAGLATLFAVGVLLLFGLGHCAVIGLAGFSSVGVQRWLDWQNGTPGAKWLRRACGLLVVIAGVYLLLTTH